MFVATEMDFEANGFRFLQDACLHLPIAPQLSGFLVSTSRRFASNFQFSATTALSLTSGVTGYSIQTALVFRKETCVTNLTCDHRKAEMARLPDVFEVRSGAVTPGRGERRHRLRPAWSEFIRTATIDPVLRRKDMLKFRPEPRHRTDARVMVWIHNKCSLVRG